MSLRTSITGLLAALCTVFITDCAFADPVVWLPDGTYVRIGEREGGDFHTLYALTSFIKNPPNELKSRRPDLWSVEHIRYWRAPGSNTQNTWDIARIGTGSHPEVIILLDRNKWIRLNTPSALSIINAIMGDSYHNDSYMPLPVTRMSSSVLESYFRGVVELYRDDSGRAQILAPGLWPDTDFSKKEIERLTPYCSKPIITRDSTKVNISLNFFNQQGAIEKWTFVISPPNSLTITKIQRQVLTANHLAHYSIPDE